MTDFEDIMILLVDDDDAFREALAQSFKLAGLKVESLNNPKPALASITPGLKAVVITDIRMARMDGLEFARSIAAVDQEIPVIMMTGHGDVPMAVQALKDGVFDFLAKPFPVDHMVAVARRAMAMRRLVLENRALRQSVEESAETAFPLLGQSPAITRVRDMIPHIAAADVDVIIEGETGTGKDVAARLIHRHSARRGRPFVVVDCAALPEALAHNVLFGDMHGEPGRVRASRGKVHAAQNGILFLDDVESLPLAVQGRLLRLIEERELPPVSGTTPEIMDIRIIASARNLDLALKEGRFRSDLLYRLDVVRLSMPPLSRRTEDIGLLFAHFLVEAADRLGKAPPVMGAELVARLCSRSWPGNVRELKNYAHRFAIGLDVLKDKGPNPKTLPEQVEEFEAEAIRQVLTRVSGDVRQALAALGIPRKTFYDKIQRHGIDLNAYRMTGP